MISGAEESELLELGWDPGGAEGPGGVDNAGIAFVEWGEKIESTLDDMLGTQPVRLALAHAEDGGRAGLLSRFDPWIDRPGFGALRELGEPTGRPSDPPGYPFANEREQWADLYKWFGESYRVSRSLEQADFDE